MARKKRKFESNLHPADVYIAKMKYKDIKRECVVRGMSFQEVVKVGIQGLAAYFRSNFYNPTDHFLLDQFDDWQEEQIRIATKNRGEDSSDIIHPSLRLGFIAERDEKGNVIKRKRVRTIVKKKKKRRERTAQGVFAGTKKALTFELQKEGLTKAEVIVKVIDQYPNASEKSIGIWFNKSKKL